MCMEMEHPTDGTTRKVDKEAFEQWSKLNENCKNDDFYEGAIDRVEDISAAMRNFLKEVVKFTVKVGKVVLKIGKIILNIVLEIVKQFPNTIAGILVGFIFGTVISSIPIIGWLFGKLFTPVTIAVVGGVIGFVADMSRNIANAGLEAKIRSRVMEDFEKAGFKFE